MSERQLAPRALMVRLAMSKISLELWLPYHT